MNQCHGRWNLPVSACSGGIASRFPSRNLSVTIDLLAEFGPALARPHADTLKTSQFPNMKELRAQHEGRLYRLLFAFDPRRVAVILLGGDKTGNARWYDQAIPMADALYAQHLNSLKEVQK